MRTLQETKEYYRKREADRKAKEDAYLAENDEIFRELRNAKFRERYADDPDFREYHNKQAREWREENKDRYNAALAKWREKNREEYNAYHREWMRKKRSEMTEQEREKRNAYQRAYHREWMRKKREADKQLKDKS